MIVGSVAVSKSGMSNNFFHAQLEMSMEFIML